MKHSGVADDDAFFDHLRLIVIRVDDTTVLNVDARSESYSGKVATNNRAEPDIDSWTQNYVAHHDGVAGDIIVVNGLQVSFPRASRSILRAISLLPSSHLACNCIVCCRRPA